MEIDSSLMGKTTIGKLSEMLVLETELDGEVATVVWPKGTVIEVSSEDEYPDHVREEDIMDAIKYLSKEENIPLLRDCWSSACAVGYHNFPSLDKMQQEFEKWLDEKGIEWNEEASK